MKDTDTTPSGGEGSEATSRSEADERTFDRTLELLADRRRRQVLKTLRETPGEAASVDDLARDLVARSPDDLARDRVRVALHHRTLPKLDEASVVDFDSRTDVARYHGDQLVEDVLDFVTTKSA